MHFSFPYSPLRFSAVWEDQLSQLIPALYVSVAQAVTSLVSDRRQHRFRGVLDFSLTQSVLHLPYQFFLSSPIVFLFLDVCMKPDIYRPLPCWLLTLRIRAFQVSRLLDGCSRFYRSSLLSEVIWFGPVLFRRFIFIASCFSLCSLQARLIDPLRSALTPLAFLHPLATRRRTSLNI